MFKAHFAPPALPKFVTSYFASHPPAWTWTVRGSPNKGKSYQVPTIPIVCKGDALRAVQWIVAVFHSFKAHLNPLAINPETEQPLHTPLQPAEVSLPSSQASPNHLPSPPRP
ncbi:hypothetical protein BKA83DRAFT_18211 [Pisolithus microcarpus]|nr:hypothetical protein BKA83DRAFT_18211 [Pisolithus microcarpus]